MIMTDQTTSAAIAGPGYLTISVGPNGSSCAVSSLNDIIHGNYLSEETMLVQIAMQLDALGTDMNNETAIREAIDGLTIKMAP